MREKSPAVVCLAGLFYIEFDLITEIVNKIEFYLF